MKNRILLAVVSLLIAVGLVACGGGGSGSWAVAELQQFLSLSR